MKDRKFHPEHGWAKNDGGQVIIGITNFAQEQLGEVAYVELPEDGDTITAGESFGSIESLKAVSELVAPVSGTVVKVNDELEETPTLVNMEPYESGWMICITPSDPQQLESLLTEEAYLKAVEG